MLAAISADNCPKYLCPALNYFDCGDSVWFGNLSLAGFESSAGFQLDLSFDGPVMTLEVMESGNVI